MKQIREQRLTELLQASTTNTTATSLVHATITRARTFWEMFFRSEISRAVQAESGFAMIDGGKLYFYKVTGLGKKQTIEGRREIPFDQMERVRRVRGGKLAPALLKVRWRNNNNKRLDLILGSPTGGIFGWSAAKQFPNQLAHINEMTQLILANNVEIKPDRTTGIAILVALVIIASAIALIGLIYLFY